MGNTEVFARRDSTIRIFSQLSDRQRKNGEDSVKYLKRVTKAKDICVKN